jgi:hypothetical protein
MRVQCQLVDQQILIEERYEYVSFRRPPTTIDNGGQHQRSSTRRELNFVARAHAEPFRVGRMKFNVGMGYGAMQHWNAPRH